MLSIIFGRISEVCLGLARGKQETIPNDEVSAINKLVEEIIIFSQNSDENFKRLTATIANKDDASLSNQLLDIRSDLLDQNKLQNEQSKEQIDVLNAVHSSLGGYK